MHSSSSPLVNSYSFFRTYFNCHLLCEVCPDFLRQSSTFSPIAYSRTFCMHYQSIYHHRSLVLIFHDSACRINLWAPQGQRPCIIHFSFSWVGIRCGTGSKCSLNEWKMNELMNRPFLWHIPLSILYCLCLGISSPFLDLQISMAITMWSIFVFLTTAYLNDYCLNKWEKLL